MLRVRAPAMSAEDVLRRFARGERPFLLDWGGGGESGRYAYAGCDPDDGLVWKRGDAGDPLRLLADAQRRWSIGPVDQHWPIAIGWIGHDLGARVGGERRFPAVDFARYRAVWRHDREAGHAEILAHDGGAAERLLARLQRPPVPLAPANAGPLSPVWSAEEHAARVARGAELVRTGALSRLVLAEQLVARVDEEGALGLYLALRSSARCGAYLRSGAITILSASTERLVRVEAVKRDDRWTIAMRSDDPRLVLDVGLDTARLLSSVLPAASLTGMPVASAIQAALELEGRERGLYGGALGWLGAGRALDLVVGVDTAVVQDGELTLTVGASVEGGASESALVERARPFARALAADA